MFLLFDLTFLAITSAIAWFLVIVVALIFVYKPLKEFREIHKG